MVCVLAALMLAPVADARGSGAVGPLAVTAVQPLDGGNVEASLDDLRIVADIGGGGDQLDPAGITITLRDTAQPAARPLAAELLPGGRVRSEVLRLTAGHRYQAVIDVVSRDGRRATRSIAFNAVHVAVEPARVRISHTEDAAPVGLDGVRLFRFGDVKVEVRNTTATMTGTSAHPGFGYIRQDVDLSRAVVRLLGPDGAELPAPLSPVPAPASWGTKGVLTQILNTSLDGETSTSKLLQVSAVARGLSLETTAPAQKAIVELDGLTSPALPLCGDPTSCPADHFPTPDPLPFYWGRHDAQMGNESVERMETEQQGPLAPPSCSETTGDQVCDYHPIISSQLQGLSFEVQWHPVDIAWEALVPTTLANPVAHSLLDYLTTYPVYWPNEYYTVCERISCNAERAEEDSSRTVVDDNQSTYCADRQGRIVEEGRCYQFITLFVGHEPMRDYLYCNRLQGPCRKNVHGFRSYVYATDGFTDAAKEEALLAVDTGMHYDQVPGWYIYTPTTEPAGFVWGTSPWGGRGYVVDVVDQWAGYHTTCKRDFDDGVFAQSEAAIRYSWNNDGIYGGLQHTNLQQGTRDAWRCPGRYERNRLFSVTLHGTAFFDAYYGNRESRVGLVFGHRKNTTSWSFGCGPGMTFFPPSMAGPGIGCGWSASAKDKDVWQRGVEITFQW